MTVWTQNGPLAAVIARKPIHLLKPDERDKVVKLEELWLDIGATSKEDAARVVRIGDPVTLHWATRRCATGWPTPPAWTMSPGCGL